VALVIVVGTLLSRYADILVRKLVRPQVSGRGAAGGRDIAAGIATGTSTVTVLGDVNLAAGGVLGSCLFNPLLALLDHANGRESLFHNASLGHIL